MDRNRDFDGRFGIVIGSASGIGRATAELLTKRGAGLALVDIQGPANEEVAQKINHSGGNAFTVVADITQTDVVNDMVERTLKTFGRIDALVIAASLLRATRYVDLTVAEWDLLLNTNLRATHLVCQAVARPMMDQKMGAIVIVSSGAGRSASITGGANYTVSKAGQIGLGRHLAQELGPHGIRTNVVCPGVTRTPMAEAYISTERFERLASRNPLRRVSAPEEQAAGIAFLLSDEASYINGVCLDINGGSQVH